jgi:hypothetical protein
LAGRHEPSSGGSFYLSLATAALRAILVVAALALGIFVLSRAFPSGEEAAPVTPGGPATTAPPAETSPPPEQTTPDAPQTHEPSEVSIQVLNGTDVAGLGAETAEVLEAEGYDVPTIEDAQNKPYEVTEIFFKRQFEADAQALRDRFFPGAELQNTAPDAAVSITVILGLDYAQAQGEGESPTP